MSTQTSAVLFKRKCLKIIAMNHFENSQYYYKFKLLYLMGILVSKHASNVPFIVVKYVVVWYNLLGKSRRLSEEESA